MSSIAAVKTSPFSLFFRLIQTSIGLKSVMALSGFGMIVFIIAHLAGNLEIFFGQDAMNDYAVFLHASPKILWVLRLGILACAIAHIWSSICLNLRNKKVRPVAYQVRKYRKTSLASRTMLLSGLMLLTFVLFHLAHFTWDLIHPEFEDLIDLKGRPDVYKMVILGFQDPVISGFYILALIFLGMHLSHGFISAPQTLGLKNPLGVQLVRKGGVCLAALISGLFISIPVCVLAGIFSV